ncbi:MAG: helix-turn-helix domain-containing protein [Terracidiphilus sp.]
MNERGLVRNETTQTSQVDPETATRYIAEKRIGERIKRLRLKKSMGLVELGKRTGLSASFLSQLETGHVVPTLKNLARIALVFSKDLSYFFESEPQPAVRIHRRQERVRLQQAGEPAQGSFFESLGYLVPDRQMDPYLAEFAPLDGQNERMLPVAHMHPGAEFLYVFEGELELHYGSQKFTLECGDSAYFDSSAPHAYQCSGFHPARALIVTLQPAPAPGPQRGSGTARIFTGIPHFSPAPHPTHG